MRITNDHSLPDALYRAIVNDEYRKAGMFSASELSSPPQLRTLKIRHDEEIVKDASDFLFIIQGKSIHKLIEHGSGNDLREESLVIDLGNGVTVSGSTDLYTGDVVDWKVTSVFSFLLGGLKPEWEAQVNVYGWLWRKHGFSTKALMIYAILRDWQKSKARERDYPAIPFQRIAVPLWDDARCETFIRSRVSLHMAAEKLSDAALPHCSAEEQWARPDSFAVKKEGRKTAVRVLSSKEEADSIAAEVKGYVEHRLGKKVRCEEYCDARPFCCQYAAEHPDKTADEFGFEAE